MRYSKCRLQLPLIENIQMFHVKHFARLKKTVYHTFIESILSYLPDSVFAKCFDSSIGRPTKDLKSILGLFLLQAMLDLTDIETVEAFTFSDTFRYALDIPRDEYLSERSYYYYRSRLLGQGGKLFESILRNVADKLKLNFTIQRKDSTHVKTWLKNMSRLEMFSETIKKFLHELNTRHPIIFSRLSDELRNKYLPKEDAFTWFAGHKPSQYEQCLVAAARDILDLIGRFNEHASVSTFDSFALLKRIAGEQIHVEGETVSVKLRDEAKGTALANPHDPDARFDGYREAVKYQVQITETCGESKNDANPRIITQVEINQANTADSTTLVPGLEKLDSIGLKPEIMLTDNGYASDENVLAAAEMGVTHVAPPGGEAPDGFGVVDFALDEEAHTIDHCPMGQTCSENRVVEKLKKHSVISR